MLDRHYLVATLARLATVPTHVPLGYDTLIEPDDPQLVHYVQEVVRPELVRLGAWDLIDAPRNNLVVRLGAGRSDRTLLIQNYTPSQHSNLMDSPFSGKIANAREYGSDEPAVFGQGVSQNKVHQAVMLTVLKLLLDQDLDLDGTLYWSVNNEGRSSHDCTSAILDALDSRPTLAALQIGTGLKLALGNRGRVDVDVHVRGQAAHSSDPDDGLSAIDGAGEVLERVKKLTWPDEHPLLGRRSAVAYLVRYEPLAPHTLPSDAYVTIDRRLLPGDDPVQATAEIRTAIGDLSPYEVDVRTGVTMLPAFLPEDDPAVALFQQAFSSVCGRPAATEYTKWTFDAGGTMSAGIPTVSFGASGNVSLTGVDLVPISAAVTEAQVLATLVRNVLGPADQR